MQNTFDTVGVSKLANGVAKVRFANGLAGRIKVLLRNGHTDVNLIECAAMTKVNAAKYALTTDAFNESERALLAAYVKANDF